jgi:hypothetical protein
MPLLDEMAAFRALWNSEAENMIRKPEAVVRLPC